MAKAWKSESPMMRALTKVFDMMLLNALVLLTSIPVITIGASLTAMHYVLLRMARDEEGYIIRSYFGAFRDNFRQSTLAFLAMAAVGAALAADFHFLDRLPDGSRGIVSAMLLAAGVVYSCCVVYFFPILARFENTLRGTFKNVLVVSVVFFIRTGVLLCLLAGFGFLYYNLPLRAAPVLLLFGVTLPGMLMAYVYTPILKKMEEQREA